MRHALRSLMRAPLMTLVVIVMLAVGIATVAIAFSFVNSIYYRPLPYPDANRIVALSTVTARGYWAWSQVPHAVVELIRGEAHSFERVGVLREKSATLATAYADPVLIWSTAVDTSVLTLIGATAQRGRLISRHEILAGAPVAVISDSLWRSRFSARDDVAGQILRLDGTTYDVVGVLQPGLRFYERSDILVPLVERPDSVRADDGEFFVMFGKLRPGVTVAQARRELQRLGERLQIADPQFGRWRFLVQDGMMFRAKGFGAASRSWMFVGVAVCVLLVACSNVANLLVVRAAVRRTELAVRASLGATRGRLIREAFTESLLLCVGAGALGTLLTALGIKLVTSLIPFYELPSWVQFGLDARVLAFTMLVTLGSVVALGLPPAIEGTRVNPVSALKAGAEAVVTNRDLSRAGRRGIVVETALSVLLLIGAALLWRSYINVSSLDVGYEAKQLVAVSVTLDRSRYPDDRTRAQFHRDLAERIADDPLVAGVALRTSSALLATDAVARQAQATGRPKTIAPLSYDEAVGVFLPTEPSRSVDRGFLPQVLRYGVSDSYFRVVGLRILSGRSFDGTDREGSAPVAVVSEQLARSVWRRLDILGETFRIGMNGAPITVIGIAHNEVQLIAGRGSMRAQAMPTIYLSERHSTAYQPITLVRAASSAEHARIPVIGAIRSLDSAALVSSLGSLSVGSRGTALVARAAATVIGTFAVFGLALTVIGLYGVVAYAVTQRKREIGLRLALGGTPDGVLRLFLADGLRMIGLGLLVGLALALAGTRLLRFLLLDVSPFDPASYAAALGGVLAVAVFACWLPAHRATRVNPAIALRSE